MMDLDKRDFYCEAVAILSGASMMLPYPLDHRVTQTLRPKE